MGTAGYCQWRRGSNVELGLPTVSVHRCGDDERGTKGRVQVRLSGAVVALRPRCGAFDCMCSARILHTCAQASSME